MDQTRREFSTPGNPQQTIEEQSRSLSELREKCHDLEGLSRSLHREKHILADMLDSTDAQIAFLDKSFHFVKVNSAYAASSGYPPEDLIGKNHFELFPNEENENLFEQARSSGQQIRFQNKPFIYPGHPEKGITYWDWTLTPIKDASGETGGFVLSLIDVTQRKLAENKLQQSAEWLRLMADFTYDWEYWIGPDKKYIYVSPSCERMTGYRPEDFINNPGLLQEITHSDDRSRIKDHFYEELEEDQVFHFDFRILTRNGQERWISHVCQLVRGKDGRPMGRRASNRDITDRKKAVQALSESEAKYSALVEHARDGVFISQEGLIKFANSALADIFGTQTDHLTGTQFSQFLSPENQFSFVEFQAKRLKGDSHPGTYQARTQSTNGPEKYLEISAAVITYEGRPALMGIVRDITQRRKLQEELATAGRLEAIGVLAGGIAHDFNNLLTAVLGYISLGKMYLQPEDKVYNLLNQAESAALHAKDVVGELVTFARNGKRVQTAYPVRRLVEESACLALAGTRARCITNISDDIWPVDIDVSQVKHAINDIIFNAEDAMPQGGIIELSAQNCTLQQEQVEQLPLKPGKYVAITIRDQGVGIPEKYLSRIFDPYFSTKERGTQKGMGMGLATAYSIVKSHKGHISVESRVGGGTTFRIYLPASDKSEISS